MPMKILVLFFSQSGQLKEILENIVKDFKDKAEIDFSEIQLVQPFPFPWTANTFFDAMPECVLQIPSPLIPMPQVRQKAYDLIILGYQPWFLSPSNPINSFLKSEWAEVLRDTPVVTVIGSRNMWLNAQEKVKADLARLQAKHVGNIVLEDKHANIVSTLTIIRWLFKGQKRASGVLPDAGVSETDITEAQRFGRPIWECLEQGALNELQEKLLLYNAVNLRPDLIILEKRGISQFPKWARKARSKGEPGDPERAKVIKRFQYLLIVAIFVLSPITNLIAKIQTGLKLKKLLQEVEYFKSVQFSINRL